MSTTITAKDVFESAKKYGNDGILEWNPEIFRPKTKGKYDCNWVSIFFKPVIYNPATKKYDDGTPIRYFKIKFKKVVTASGAKLPKFSEEDPKYMQIAFRKMTTEDLNFGDFFFFFMGNADDQIIENERIKKLVDEYLVSTNEFNEVLEIIDASYHKICEEIKNAKSLGFSVRKDKKAHKHNKDVPVSSIIQITREDKEALKTDSDAPPIKLQFPLSRLKLSLERKTGRVVCNYYNKINKAFDVKPNVYNVKKMTKKNNYTSVLATVKNSDGKIETLNKNNTETFITAKSIIGGEWQPIDICCSKVGFSLNNEFLDTYVSRNKNVTVDEIFSFDELQDMAGLDEDEGSESDVEMAPNFNKLNINNNKIYEIEDSDLETPNGDVLDADENSDLEDGAEED